MITDERMVQILFADIDHIDFSRESESIISQIVVEISEAVNTTRWMMEIAYPDHKKEIAEFQEIFNILNHPYEDSLMNMIEDKVKIEKLERLL